MKVDNLWVGGISIDNHNTVGNGKPFVTTHKSDLNYFYGKSCFRAPTKISTFNALKTKVKEWTRSNHLEAAMDGATMVINAFGQLVRHGEDFRPDITTPQHGTDNMSPIVSLARGLTGEEDPKQHLVDAGIMWILGVGPNKGEKSFKGGDKAETERVVETMEKASKEKEMSTHRAEAQVFMKCMQEARNPPPSQKDMCACIGILQGEVKSCMLGWSQQEEADVQQEHNETGGQVEGGEKSAEDPDPAEGHELAEETGEKVCALDSRTRRSHPTLSTHTCRTTQCNRQSTSHCPHNHTITPHSDRSCTMPTLSQHTTVLHQHRNSTTAVT